MPNISTMDIKECLKAEKNICPSKHPSEWDNILTFLHNKNNINMFVSSSLDKAADKYKYK